MWQESAWWRWMWQWSIWALGGRENWSCGSRQAEVWSAHHNPSRVSEKLTKPRTQTFKYSTNILKCCKLRFQTSLNKFKFAFELLVWCVKHFKFDKETSEIAANLRKHSAPLPHSMLGCRCRKMFVFASARNSDVGLITAKQNLQDPGSEHRLWWARAPHVTPTLTSSISRFAGING